ncbi:hypothetical protein ABZ897_03260 [Nonomuraea sp. NPDC046802]|uniref:hypothetical protein n=1 Tax=Nonomuraea sp. NPDC046802 TaxID=3154919 RepID=UPI0033E56FAF
MRRLVLLAALLAGCSSTHPCTMVGTPVGVSVHVQAPLAARAQSVSMEVCWDGSCRPVRSDLMPSTKADGSTCSGDTCSATAVETGDKNTFGDVQGLPARAVRVRLKLLDAEAAPVFDRTLDVTPKMRYPNGPECGAGGPNAVLTVGADGTVRES